MVANWKTVRVFISSTFSDMQAERDWLVKRVFPALRQKLEPLRIHLVDIDLRWGITREQAENDQVLGLCLQQIDECRPFFLGLLGGRYGWVPSKFPVEVGKRYGWTQHQTDKSLTELEILHGVLNDAAMHERALFCFRSERFLDNIKDEQQRRVYVEGATGTEMRELGPEEAEHHAAARRQQLAELKNQIRVLSPPMPLFDGYPCTWDAATVDPQTKQPGRIGNLTEFGNWVIEKLERAILDAKELQEHLAAVRSAVRDDLAEERDFHERYIESRTRVYIGRKTLQEELKAFVAGAEAMPCLVTGPSGSGKSAALAKFVSVWRDQHPQDVVITHFVGASPRSTGQREMLRHLCAELKDAMKLEDEIKLDIRELSDQFREFLAKAPADRRILLVLDALNQLDETDNAHSFFWLPWQLPSQVRLIVSCIDDPDRAEQAELVAMLNRQPHEIKIGPLSDEERVGIVREIPSAAAKKLDEEQVKLLLKNEATRNPLFLLVALEELRGFGSFEQLNRKIAGLPQTGETLTAIFQQVIRRLAEDFNAKTVKDMLTLLACARHGLSEREMLDLIEGENVAIEESAGDMFPILRQLRPYLQTRGALLDFFHRHLAKAVHEEFFLGDESLQPASHARLADYFLGCARGDDSTKEWETESVRGFSECVFHLALARLYDQAAMLLSSFPFLLHKTRVGLFEGVHDDYEIVTGQAPGEVAKRLEVWTAFFHEKAHILRRVNDVWPAYKILLQLAVEHADESPLTVAAEQWLEEGCCHWLWLRRNRRLPDVQKNPCLTVLEGHTATVDGALALADGRLLSWSEDNTLRLWGSHNGVCLAVLEGHTATVDGALALADGRLLSWSYDNTLRLWDDHSGVCLAVLEGHTGAVWGALALADGRLLSWSYDNTLRLWDDHSGVCLAVLEGHTGKVNGALALADGRLLSWTGGYINGDEPKDNTLRLWDSQSGVCLAVLEGHTGMVKGALALAYGGLLSWSDDNTLRLWDGHSGACLAVLEGHEHTVWGGLAMTDGRLLSWSLDNTLRLWDSHSGVCLAVLEGHTGSVCGALALADGRLLSWSTDNTLRLWDSHSGVCLAVLEGHTGMVKGALALTDGRLLSWSTDHTLRLWDGHSGACLTVLVGHTMIVNGALMLADGRLFSWSWGKNLRLWDGHSGVCLAVLEGHTDMIQGALVLADRRLLSWSLDATLRLWDSHSGVCLAVLEGHTGAVWGALALADGRLLSWSDDNNLRLWDGHSGLCLAILVGHTQMVYGALALADGRLLSWTGGYINNDEPKDNTLRLWGSHSGVCLAVLEGHTDMVKGALALADGRLLSWSYDNTLRLWDSHSGMCLEVLEGHTDTANGALALADVRLLSWSDDNTLRLWDGHSGTCLAVLEGHTGKVNGALALADGRLLSWSTDNTLRLWDGHSGSCLAVLEGHEHTVWGGLAMADGRLLSWSHDNTLRLWDGYSGVCLAVVKEDQAATLHPEWLHARQEVQNPGCVVVDFFSGSWARMSYLCHKSTSSSVFAGWQAESDVKAHCLLMDGTVGATQDNGQVCFLKLHHGQRRISLAEAAEALLVPQSKNEE